MTDSAISRPIVAVTQRIDGFPDRDEQRDAVDQKLLSWIFAAGFLPVTVSNIYVNVGEPESAAKYADIKQVIEAIKPAALLLSGGNNIGEFPARDGTEGFLLEWAKDKKIPVLGICRGLQMMAVSAGVNLEPVAGHVRTRHSLHNRRGDKIWPASINSYHEWGLAGCPNGYEVMVTVEDGSIEAIRHVELPWEGWMWHPERETPFAEQDLQNLKRLFNEGQ